MDSPCILLFQAGGDRNGAKCLGDKGIFRWSIRAALGMHINLGKGFPNVQRCVCAEVC